MLITLAFVVGTINSKTWISGNRTGPKGAGQAKHHEGDVLLCRGPLDSDWMILFFGDVAQPGRENRSLLGLVKIPISNTKYGDQKYHKNIHKHEYTCYSHLNYPS